MRKSTVHLVYFGWVTALLSLTPMLLVPRTQEEPPKDKPMPLPKKAVKKLKAIFKSLNAVRSFEELKDTFSANSYNFQKYKGRGDG